MPSARLLAPGAHRVDVGQTPDASWVVLADPEGNELCLLSRAVQDPYRQLVRPVAAGGALGDRVEAVALEAV